MGTKNKNKKNSKLKEPSTENITKDDNAMETATPEAVETEVCAPISATADNAEAGEKKSYRKRKKHYYNAIRGQMEFYFGDANLSKDRFLKQLIDKEPYVPLEIFLTFNKMKALTTNAKDIAKSLSNSQLLELDETKQKVKRKIPVAENRNVDEKTLYVEALPSSADHEWVRQIFERFGKVAYISLPKYAKSRKIKEFGFVEFEKEESVTKAIKSFKDFNGVLSMQEKDPSDLISVKSYIKEQSGEKEDTEEPIKTFKDTQKRVKNDEVDDETEPKAKKSKTESQNESETSNTEDATSQSDSEANAHNEEGHKEEALKKKRRKRKKKTKTTEKLKRKAELNTDVAYYELKILPKKDWKRLRNKYLNLQREKVAELKRKAWREQQELKQQKDTIGTEENTLQTAGQIEKNTSKGTAKHKLQKMNMNFYGAAEEETPSKLSTTEKSQQNPALGKAPLFTYEPGLIVEVSFIEPCVNIKEFKADMRQYATVKYVDIKEGAMQSFLRLESPQKALEFIQQLSCAEYQCKILSDEAETSYWQKIEKDREQKLNKQVKIPQKRGREKVKKLISKHIRFGDDDE